MTWEGGLITWVVGGMREAERIDGQVRNPPSWMELFFKLYVNGQTFLFLKSL